MTARTPIEQRRHALRRGRIARRAMWAAIAVEFLLAARLAVSVYSSIAAFILLATTLFAAFDALALAPLIRSAQESIARDEQQAARLDALLPKEGEL